MVDPGACKCPEATSAALVSVHLTGVSSSSPSELGHHLRSDIMNSPVRSLCTLQACSNSKDLLCRTPAHASPAAIQHSRRPCDARRSS